MCYLRRCLLASLCWIALASLLASSTASAQTSGPGSSFLPSLLSQELSEAVSQRVTEHVVQQWKEDPPSRELQNHEFDQFRQLLSNAVIRLPDFKTSASILFFTLNIQATNVKCFNIILNDMNISYALESKQSLKFQVDINDLNLKCTLDYKWSYSFFDGAGTADVTLANNYVSTSISFASENFDLYPPTNSSVDKCTANISITNMNFAGSITDTVLNVFEPLLRGFVENTVSSTVCDEMGSLGTTLVQDMIDRAAKFLNPYLDPLPLSERNATVAEAGLTVPSGVNLMNYKDDGPDQSWFYSALKQIDSAFGVWLIDPNAPSNRENGKDLGINIFLRKNVLDNNRALVVNVADLPFDFNPVLFQGHDELTETVITLKTVRALGLDTFNYFAPFMNQGKYTLGNDMKWDFLTFELDVVIDIKPSNQSNSIIQDPNSQMAIQENVKMGLGVDDVAADVSVLMAIDQDMFGALKLGPLLFETNLLPCFMSSVFKSEITVFNATVGNIRDPVLDGFISPGIDNIVTKSVKAAFLMYESVVIRAIPNIFQETVKGLINDSFFHTYVAKCPPPNQTEGFIDFRDLLLDGNGSLALGGSGDEPYGNVAAGMMSFLMDQLATLEGDGTVSANDMFIRPLTEKQSGVPGTLAMPGELFALSADAFDLAGFDLILQGFKMSLSDVRAQNLDTLVPPLRLLEPTTNPHAVDNELHIGPLEGRPLNMSARLSVFFGETSPLAMDNDIELSMTSVSFEALLELVARVQAMAMFNFPIEDLLNFNCWLATIPPPAMNDLGLRIDPSEDRGLSLVDFSNKFEDLNVGVNCIRCTGGGMAMLPSMLQIMREAGVTGVLSSRMKFLVQDIVVSDTFQTVLDRLVLDARKSCPHSSEYLVDAGSSAANYADLPLPSFSATSLDTAEFIIGTALQVGFVIFTQAHVNEEVNPEDALNEQNNFTAPTGSNLVNFTDFNLNLPSWLDSAVSGVLDMVRGTRTDPATGQEELGVNIFMRDLFGQSGVMDLSFDGLEFGPEELMIQLHSLRVEGLDTFTKFDILKPAADQTVLNDIAMQTVTIALDLSLNSENATQRMSVAFQFDDLSASVPLFMAIDKDLLKSVQLGSLLRIESIMPCLLNSVYGFKIPHMIVNIGTIYKPLVAGLMEETKDALTALVNMLFEQYGSSMHDAIPSMFDNAIRPFLNALFDSFIIGSARGCTNPIIAAMSSARRLMQSAGPPFLDFRDLLLSREKSKLLGGRGDSRYGDLIRTVWDLIEGRLLKADESTGILPLNADVIDPLTKGSSGTPGTLSFPGDILAQDLNIAVGGLAAGVSFSISDILVENVDTVGTPFSILDPVKDAASLLNNTATIGTTDPLRVILRFFLKIQTDGEIIKDDFDISADFNTFSVVLTTLLKVSEYRFAAFPIGDIFSLDCWLATIPPPPLDAYGIRIDGVEPTAALEELILSMQKLKLNITCNNCTSPGMQKLADLWSTPEASAGVTKAANDLMSYFVSILGDKVLQSRIDRRLNDAAKRCPHSPDYEENYASRKYKPFEFSSHESKMQFVVMLMIVAACLIVIIGLLILAIRFIVRRRHCRWLRTLPKAHVVALKRRQEKEEEKEAELNAMTQSMFTSCDIPLFVRWSVPLIILGNIAFFLSGHLSLAAEVKIQASIAGQLLEFDQFYQFSMAQSTVEIWQAGGKELASLILIFSGIWPYTKQLITLALWFLPTKWCSISRRGSILLVLDGLAKWSIVDIFTLVVSVAAFRLTIRSPDVSFLPNDFYSVDLLVVPLWGLYANMIAQLISQVSSHFIIHYHRNIVCRATKFYKQNHHLVSQSVIFTQGPESDSDIIKDPYGDRKDVLYTHAYARPHRAESEKLMTRGYVNSLVLAVAIILSVLIIVGCSLPSTGLEFLGILGVAVESGQDWKQAVRDLSLFDLLGVLMDQARFIGDAKDYVGLGSLSALVTITVLFVPLAQTATLLWQWFVPMAGGRRKRLSLLVEILQAWQYCEVYIISVIVATWQLGPISTFMINDYCTDFQETFDMLAFFGFINQEDAQCFRVDASIQNAAYILAAGAVCLALLNTFVMNAVNQYFRDRDEVNSRAEWKAILFSSRERDTDGTGALDKMCQEELIVKGEINTTLDLSTDDIPDEDRFTAEKYIKPVPVLFTDKFRWLLRGADPNESLNGRAAPPLTFSGLTEKPLLGSDGSSTSDEEQPTAASPCSVSRSVSPAVDDQDELTEKSPLRSEGSSTSDEEQPTVASPYSVSRSASPTTDNREQKSFESDLEQKSQEDQNSYLGDISDVLPQKSEVKEDEKSEEENGERSTAATLLISNTFPPSTLISVNSIDSAKTT